MLRCQKSQNILIRPAEAAIEVDIMLKRKVLGLLSVVLFALCFVIPVTAQMIPPGPSDTGLGGVNTITGMVLASTGGRRLERRVTIRLQTMTRGDRVIMTDENGNFAFRGLPSGDYTIVIDKEKDFEPYSQSVSVIQMRGFPPQGYTLSIRLVAKAGTDAKPAVVNTDFADVPKPALELYNKAIELAKTGDRKGAIEQLQLSVAEYPKFMLAFNEMGVQYLRLNELEKADESLLSALKIEPEAYTPLMNRGIVLFQMKRFAEAEPVVRNALKVKEQSAVGRYFLGQSLANLGRFDEAEKELVSAVGLGGDEMKEAHRLLAIIYSSRGDKKRAVAELETYLRLAPKTPDAEQLRQVILQLKGLAAPAPATSSNTKPSP